MLQSQNVHTKTLSTKLSWRPSLNINIKIANEMEDRHFCGSRLYKTESTLTGGAFYKDPSGMFNEEI